MLKNELETAKRSVTTDSLQISIGEISSMYAAGELDIIPEFQRLFRWSPEKKTAFIESILIGIPVPPAFAFEEEDGTWELIDGLQRISTILEFMGILRDPEEPQKVLAPSVLTASTYLPSLKGITWDEIENNDGGSVLEKPLQLFFRRARLDFKVLKHPSDAKTKFDLFQRLNRGGEYANEQEVRTCSMVLGNPEATRRMREIAHSVAFAKITKITGDQKSKQKDVEYVVRAVVHVAEDYSSRSDVQEFLDKGILNEIIENDPNPTIDKVKWAVETLHQICGDDALMPHKNAHKDIAHRFSLRALEGILVGIARNKESIEAQGGVEAYLKDRIYNFWIEDEVATLSSSGLRGTTRIQRTIPYGEAWFKPNA